MSTTVTLTEGQARHLAEHLGEYGSVRFAAQPGLTFTIARAVGTCPACGEPVYNEDEPDGPVWACPADLSPSNPYREPAPEWITDELRAAEGVYSNCAEDFGEPCYEPMPLHGECYDHGRY